MTAKRLTTSDLILGVYSDDDCVWTAAVILAENVRCVNDVSDVMVACSLALLHMEQWNGTVPKLAEGSNHLWTATPDAIREAAQYFHAAKGMDAMTRRAVFLRFYGAQFLLAPRPTARDLDSAGSKAKQT